MKKLFIAFHFLFFGSCKGITGWFPGWDNSPQTSSSQPTVGCSKDLNVHFKNNCTMSLIMYFIEINPGSNFLCENLNEYGIIALDATKSIIIHKGKLGFVVFAEYVEGKCTGGHRKSERWINCEKSTSDEVIFNVCN